MSKALKSKKEKIPRMTEEQYAEYVSSLKDEEPISGYAELVAGRHSTPHVGAPRNKEQS